MKRWILAFGLALLATPAIGASVAGAPTTRSIPRSLLARVTVYWASGGHGSDRWTRRHQTATSVRLRVGHCAVDPKKIPYGSKVYFPDATLVAVDTGRHVISRKAARGSGRNATERGALVIDRFFETKGQALRWARTNPQFMTVKIVPPNSRPEAQANLRVANLSPSQQVVRRATPSRPTRLAARTLPSRYVR